MIDIFTPPPSDVSITLLGSIFGSMGGVIPVTVQGTSTLLGDMFRYFNTVILAVAALVVIYTTIVGVISTAHEGEFMGKKYNNPWIFIRMVIGIAALVPTASGFSAIQIVMMWVVVHGIGAADLLWIKTLNAIVQLGSPFGQGSPQDAALPTSGVKQSFQSLFESLTCDATARMRALDPTGVSGSSGKKGGGYFCNVNPGGFCNNQPANITTNTRTYDFGPNKECGSITLCDWKSSCKDPNSTACKTCTAQYSTMQSIISTFTQMAQNFASADYTYRNFYANTFSLAKGTDIGFVKNYCSAQNIPDTQCCVPSSIASDPKNPLSYLIPSPCQGSTDNFPSDNQGDKDPSGPSSEAVNSIYKPYGLPGAVPAGQDPNSGITFIDTAVDQYVAAIKANLPPPKANTSLEGKFANLGAQGWALAGSFYYTLAQENQNVVHSLLPSLTTKQAAFLSGHGTMAKYRNNYSAAGELVGAANTSFTDQLHSPMAAMQSNFMALGQSGVKADPIMQLSIAGLALLWGAIALYLTITILTGVIGIAGNISVFVLGTGVTNPVGPAAFVLSMLFLPLFYGILGYMITVGGMLGIYVPLIPYIVFIMGVIGWLLAVIEAMVAAPLVALGILSPSQHHELMGKAEPALGMLFNIFLRPSLMLFGLMAAMLLANVVVQLINKTYWGILVNSLIGAYNPIGMVMFIAAYVILIVTALNKCFTLIHLLPSAVLGWLGLHGAPGGQADQEAVSAAKGAVSSAGSGATSGLTKGAGLETTGAAQKKTQFKGK